jgi:hypothetical protein
MPYIDFISVVHKSTKRDYLGRVNEYPKAEAAKKSKKWGYNYWDGDRRLFGAIGALVVRDDVGRYAEKAGLYVLTQTSEGGAALVNRKNFRAKEFG